MISVENERNFENMLFADASALPPPQDIVTPWHTAMHYILWGLGLTTITLHFLNLDVILTAVGAALLVLGFRILRQENASLRWGFRLALAALAVRCRWRRAWRRRTPPWRSSWPCTSACGGA